jgi:hypothetical protein
MCEMDKRDRDNEVLYRTWAKNNKKMIKENE